VLRRAIEIFAVLAALGGVAAMPAPAVATPPCPVEYCTDSTGRYELVVPPLSTYPVLKQYADCIWAVHVDFGDGSGEDLVFDASVGLTASHVFPTPGFTYKVQVQLTEGHHGAGAEPCFDYNRKAEVRYRTPAEEEEKEDETPAPWEVIKQESIVPVPVQVAPDAQTPTPFAEPALPGSTPVAFWRHCRGGVRTHGVACRKGRLVIDRAGEKLARGGSGPVAGFNCRLTSVSVVCRKGADRVLGPPA
jgi:hypothetical protein